ncbi:hypothetical protein EC991_006658 [Linnemannia zychae]|nr:hypothetical protein EC991_006658 [Linnemannia zychae]
MNLLTVILETQGTYCESSWNPKFGHVWILFINFTSVTLATYFLIMFYFTVRTDLKEYEPFYKFLAIKLLQQLSTILKPVLSVIAILGGWYIKASKYWSTGDISIGINALLIDFEMVIFALMHLKAFSYKPYVPKIPNPDLPQPLLSPDGDQGNDADNNNDPSLASLSDDTLPTATGGRTQWQQKQQQTGGPKRKPAPTTSSTAIPIDGSKSKSSSGKKADKKSDKKKSKKDEGPPETIMDFTQKTPIWRGILDSFNPLDTIRELSYGCKYMYKWLRGIPVDKDSRRLLDLEVAFGRVRPEVPYTPTKEELEKEKKKKKKQKEKERKKRRKKGLESDEDGTSSNDDEDDDEEDEDDNGDKDLEKGTRRADNNDSDGDDGENNEKGRQRQESDSGEGTGAGHGTVSRYRKFPDSNRPSGRDGRRTDATIDMGEGAGAEEPYSRSTIARKPVKAKAVKTAANPILPRLERDPSIKLEKADAARTERATLPDIQIEPVERKIALSGFYVDLPLSPTVDTVGSPNSSVDIPIPKQYRHEHHHQYQSPYDAQEPRAGGGGRRGEGTSRDWDYERHRRPRDHRVEIDQEPSSSRFNHRDRDLERAAAAGSYVLPIPVAPKSPEPHLPNANAINTSQGRRVEGGEGSVPVDIDGPPRGGLTRLANDNFVTKGNPYQYDREFDYSDDNNRSRKNNGGYGFTRDPAPPTVNDHRITALSYYGQQQHQGVTHQRGDSVDTSVFTITTNTDSLAAPGEREGFYHHREASRSDPELSHYGHDHEHYLERMHYLEEQDQQAQYYLQLQQQQLQREERRRSQFPLSDHPEPSPSTSASAPVPAYLPSSVDAPLAATAHDRTSVFIQGEDSDLFPSEMRKGNRQEGESTLLSSSGPAAINAPVGSQVPDPGKVIDAAAAATPAEQQKVSQVVQEDPIVVEYNLLQHRQKLQEQQRTQQELQYQEQQQQRQLHHEQSRDNPQHRATMNPHLPPPVRQRQLLPHRRNSIESLDSDSSSGGFRVHDYGLRPTGVGGGVSRVPKGSNSRYQQAYRYPMPLPQPVPPAQLYQFPQDRDLYDRQRRERNRDRDWDRNRSRDQQHYYQQQPYQQQQSQQQPQYSSRPYMDDYSRQPYMPQAQPQYGRSSADTRYRSPPPPTLLPLDDRSSRPIRRIQEPVPRDRRDRDRDPRYTRERDSRDPYYQPESPSENLFPASRYAAPFVRDYELQQRERDGRQRATRSPPILDPSSLSSSQQQAAQRWQQTATAAAPPVMDRTMIPQPGRRGGGDIDGRSRVPPPRQTPGVAAYEDDGPYEEAVVWTRQQPIAVPTPTLRD